MTLFTSYEGCVMKTKIFLDFIKGLHVIENLVYHNLDQETGA